MRMRTVGACLCGAVLMVVSARPAEAQGAKIDFAGGYQYLTFLEDNAVGVPLGWGVSVGAGKEWIKFVADVGGHYEDHDSHFAKLHTFQGGAEFSGKNGRVVPFGRALTGVAVLSDLGSDAVWVFTPEAGVKIMATERVGFQASAGFPIFVDDGSLTGFRLFAGFVIRK